MKEKDEEDASIYAYSTGDLLFILTFLSCIRLAGFIPQWFLKIGLWGDRRPIAQSQDTWIWEDRCLHAAENEVGAPVTRVVFHCNSFPFRVKQNHWFHNRASWVRKCHFVFSHSLSLFSVVRSTTVSFPWYWILTVLNWQNPSNNYLSRKTLLCEAQHRMLFKFSTRRATTWSGELSFI